MRIPIVRSPELKRIILCEFQGKIITEKEFAELREDAFGEISPSLEEENKEGTRHKLIIGHHEIEGVLTNLSKPVAVTRKEKNEKGEVVIRVTGVASKKLVFKKRPVPIFSSSAKVKLN